MALNFFKNLKAKRAAKQAQARYQEELTEWQSETDLLTQALEIFTSAAEGKKIEDQSLVQKDGEFVIWTGNAVFHEAGRTPTRYAGGSAGFSVPVGAGIRVRVGSHRGTLVPGDAMQMDKDEGFVKLTNQRLIFAGALETNEWAFSKILSVAKTEDGNDFLIGVSNRKKTSGLRFTYSDAKFFSRIFAMALYAYEEGIPETITTIKKELKQLTSEKPALTLPASDISQSNT
jgi:hypothetical protein